MISAGVTASRAEGDSNPNDCAAASLASNRRPSGARTVIGSLRALMVAVSSSAFNGLVLGFRSEMSLSPLPVTRLNYQ